MSKKLEIKQIAEELALSSTTVSRALSGKGRVSDATRQRVQEYIKANNAAPAVRRRPYTARKTRNILVTVASRRFVMNLTHSIKYTWNRRIYKQI